MGCVCSKSPNEEDLSSSKKYSELTKARNSSIRARERFDLAVDVKAKLIERKAVELPGKCDDDRREVVAVSPAIGKVPNCTQGEQVAAGWPVWLAAAASEAIRGWLPRRADTFEKLNKIGQGTYSSVYKARDVVNNRFVALKKVRFDTLDVESVKFMAREILVLRRLDHPNIIKLEGLITSRTSCSLYLVFEYMEHDLTGLASRPGMKFTEPQVKCYMQQLLSGLDHCHRNGVLHRDIKGSNLLVDDNGVLKIADFGLASFYDPKLILPLTSRVVTLWYRPPELLLGASHYGVAVDLWSTGCILGELYSGKPILPGKTEVEQLHKIFKLCGSPSDDYWSKLHLRHSTVMKPPQPYRRCIGEAFKELPQAAVQLIEILLSIDPVNRGTADIALKSEFFTTRPLACDPSSLPKYPPSKEIDAKIREEEARRQGANVGRGQNADSERRGPSETQPVCLTNPDSVVRQDYSNMKSNSEIFGRRRDEKTVSGFLVGPAKQPREVKDTRKYSGDDVNRRASHSGPLVHRPRCLRPEREGSADPVLASNRANLSKLSDLVAARFSSCENQQQVKPAPSLPETMFHAGRLSSSANHGEEPTKPQERNHRSFKTAHDEKTSSLYGHSSKANKIYVSGPLLVSSNSVDQMLKDHDRRIQEFARKTRLAKNRPGMAVNPTPGATRSLAG